MKHVLVTGGAGFIGFHVVNKLLENNCRVSSIDNLNSYYSPKLKEDRLSVIKKRFQSNYNFIEGDITQDNFSNTFSKEKIDIIIHLAAQAGVRNSIQNPKPYILNNIVGHFNIIELARKQKVKHLLSASTSSVYGGDRRPPFSEFANANLPIQLYAATKRANEIVSHSYSAMFNIPTTMMRFFTVYGTWGRPDMALFKFVKSIQDGNPVELYNRGNHSRSFTSVEDISETIIRLLDKPPMLIDRGKEIDIVSAPYRELNIGNRKNENIKDFIRLIENCLNKKAKVKMLPLQKGDVEESSCDPTQVESLTGYKIERSVETEIPKFIEWYKDYYELK
jgi:UDP-glucuronate 4-epimerase